MVLWLVGWTSYPKVGSLRPGLGRCVRHEILLHIISLHLGVNMGTGDKMLEVTKPIQGIVAIFLVASCYRNLSCSSRVGSLWLVYVLLYLLPFYFIPCSLSTIPGSGGWTN